MTEHITYIEVFDALETLSNAHSTFEREYLAIEDARSDHEQPMDEENEEIEPDRVGFYKESDFAVWALRRVVFPNGTMLALARLNRMHVLDADVDGMRFDSVIMIRSGDDQPRINVISHQGIRVAPEIGAYAMPEFFLPAMAYEKLSDEWHAEYDSDDAPSSLVESFSVEPWERLLDTEDTDLIAMIRAALNLDVDSRYVGFDINEHEALSGREGTKVLANMLDTWAQRFHEDLWQIALLRGSGSSAFDEDDGSDYAEFKLAVPMYDGNILLLSRYRNASSFSHTFSDTIGKHVQPPSVLGLGEDEEGFTFLLQLGDLANGCVNVYSINTATFTTRKENLSTEQWVEGFRLAADPRASHPNRALSWSMQDRVREIANSPRYLTDQEVDLLCEALEDVELFLNVIVDHTLLENPTLREAIRHQVKPLTGEQRSMLERLISDQATSDSARELLEWRLARG